MSDNIIDLSIVKSDRKKGDQQDTTSYDMTFFMEDGEIETYTHVYAVIHGGLFGPDFIGLVRDTELLASLSDHEMDTMPMPEDYVNTMLVKRVKATKAEPECDENG